MLIAATDLRRNANDLTAIVVGGAFVNKQRAMSGDIGWIELMHDWDWPAARTYAVRALQLNPSSPEAHVFAQYLRIAGSLAEDLHQRKQAVALDPCREDL